MFYATLVLYDMSKYILLWSKKFGGKKVQRDCLLPQCVTCSIALSLSKSGGTIAVSKLYLNSNSWDQCPKELAFDDGIPS